jgi:hypothetical protein
MEPARDCDGRLSIILKKNHFLYYKKVGQFKMMAMLIIDENTTYQ